MDPGSRNPSSAARSPADNPDAESSNEEIDPDSEYPQAEDRMDVAQDPLFQTREELVSMAFERDETADLLDDELPPAFSESPLIRSAYVTAFLLSSFHHATHESIRLFLDSQYNTLVSVQRQTGLVVDGLATMARTLPTVERRLRLDPNPYITYFFVCTECWSRHHPLELQTLEDSHCAEPGCPGELFTTKQLSGGKIKRIPTKIFPTAPLVPMLQRFLLRPGKFDEYQHWRKPGEDNPQRVEPTQDSPPEGNLQESNARMYDIYDGWGWRAIQAGLERRQGGPWGIEDVDVHDIHQ